MQLTINKKEFTREFVYDYLPSYMYNILKGSINKKEINRLNSAFKFNSEDVLLFSFLNLKISSDDKSYYISIDKNLKYGNFFINQLVKMINYGNLTTKRYSLSEDIFKFINDNIYAIYDRWKKEF